jgi:hypothetical protein
MLKLCVSTFYTVFLVLPNFYLSRRFAHVAHHSQQYQQHPNNHGESMCVVEIFGNDASFRLTSEKWVGDMSIGVLFS